MSVIAIVYHSGSGKTKRIAEAIAAGAGEVPGASAKVLAIVGEHITKGRYENEALLTELDSASAIVFGSPTYMGMVSGQFKAFADATGGRWYHGTWKNKLAGGFTTSGSPSGDKQGTLLYLATLAAQHQMLWVGSDSPNGVYAGQAVEQATNRLGSYLGVMSQIAPTPEGVPTPGDLATAGAYGKRIASLALR